MASLKQATYVREQYPDAKIYIFYIDIRSPGQRYEKFYKKVKDDENVFFIKGKVAEGGSARTQVRSPWAENAVTGEKSARRWIWRSWPPACSPPPPAPNCRPT
jgi:quinone-modifying oxidoreductase subunit QmoA